MRRYLTFCVTLIIFISSVEALSRFCPLAYTVLVSKQEATTFGCGRWGAKRCTSYRQVYYVDDRIDERHCCANFTGENCDIPVCDPPCESPAPCVVEVDKNICYCPQGSSGDACNLAACSPSNNCFPGTCRTDTQECVCSPGYGGKACTDILTSGLLTACEIQFIKYDGTSAINLANYDCVESSLETAYTSANGADYLDLTYTLTFEGPETPPFPSYIRELKIGLIETTVDGIIITPEGEMIQDTTTCVPEVAPDDTAPNKDNPYQTVRCKDRKQLDKSKLIHQGELAIDIHTRSGGYKKFIGNDNQINTTYYSGAEYSFVRNVTFDFKSPGHCSLITDDECGNPCVSYYDITTSPLVLTEWFGWSDDDSGISSYTYSIYKMSTGTDGKLTEINLEIPMFTESVQLEGYFFEYTFTDSGMYSIILKVTDHAGNSYRSRSLVLFDDSSDISVDESNKVTVDNSLIVGERLWFRESSADLVIHWEGRYSNEALHSNNWLKAVKNESDNLFDDKYGNRTIDAIENKEGIVSFIITYDIGNFDDLAESPVGLLENMKSLEETFTLSELKEDGKAVRFFITVIDALGNEKIEIEVVHFDSSGAEFNKDSSTVEINAMSEDPELPFATKLDLRLQDRHSGIQNIKYQIFDVSEGRSDDPIFTGSQDGTVTNKQTCEFDGDCYCLPIGECYGIIQTIWLDHCQLIDQVGRTLQLDMIVLNGAGLQKQYLYSLGQFIDPVGVAFYPEPTAINYQGDVPKVTITWVISQSCYVLQSVLLKVSEGGVIRDRELNSDTRRFELETIKGTEYAIVISSMYSDGQISDSDSITFKTPGEPPVPPEGQSSEDGGGGINEPDLITTAGVLGGIAVGGAIFLALVVLIIVMIVRKKQQKPVVPPVLREKATRLRENVSSRLSRISQYFGRQSQAEEEEDDEEKGVTTRSTKRRRSFGFRLSKYEVQDSKSTHEGKRRNDRDKEREGQKDGSKGRMKKGVSFEAEENEDNKSPKSILKSVPENDEKSDKENGTKTSDASSDPATSHALSGEVKKYGKMVVPKDATWLIADGAYSLGNAVSNTHSCFSEMRMATLRHLGSASVVVKTNRPGASYEDKMEMTALMNFMATEVPKHENIVAFLGAVPPTAKTAPILFFEYCDEGNLLNWVKETRNVTDEIEDQMINFAIHIASGMDHMHLNGMLHRKLRAKHILLKHSFANQMVAKVSGFGPENDTVVKDDEGEDSTQRWVAPEQYDKIKLFTHKTDIWSYGILLHEMFNMGKEPYSGMSVTEMKESVKSGFRMGKPKYAPEFMYNGVMKQCWQQNQSDRPDFSELGDVMMAYFEGGKGEADLDQKKV